MVVLPDPPIDNSMNILYVLILFPLDLVGPDYLSCPIDTFTASLESVMLRSNGSVECHCVNGIMIDNVDCKGDLIRKSVTSFHVASISIYCYLICSN